MNFRFLRELLAVAIICAFIISCSKGSPPDLIDNHPPENPSQVLLAKFVFRDTAMKPPRDTILIMHYSYDDKERLTQTRLIHYNWTGHPDTSSFNEEYWTYRNYYYTGSDTMPYKIISESKRRVGFIEIGRDTAYRRYDALSRLIVDSVKEYGYMSGGINPGSYGTVVNYYTYGDNYVIKNHYAVSKLNTFTGTDSIIQNKIRGNVVYQTDPRPYPAPNTYMLFPTDNFELDEHPNPCNKNGAFSEPLYRLRNTWGIGMYIENQKNNYLSIKTSDRIPTGSNDNYYRYEYVYGANGYPLKVRLSHHFGDPTTSLSFQGVYVYY